jgi:hypothetical protein
MTSSTGAPLRPLRLWPALIIAGLLVLVRFFIPRVVPDATPFGLPIGIAAVLGGVAGGLALAVIVGNTRLVRNGQEMAAFGLPVAAR